MSNQTTGLSNPQGKFIRNYVMKIQTTDSAINNSTPEYVVLEGTDTQICPFTLEFDIVRNVANAATGNFRVYNLSPLKRLSIVRDGLLGGTFQTVELYAGYGLNKANLPLVFKGYANVINSNRENTNVVTSISCIGFEDTLSFYDNTFDAGVSYQQMVQDLASSIKGVTIGAIGNFPGTPPTGQSFSSFTMEGLNNLTNGGAFIDNTKIYCLNQNEIINNPDLPVIDASTGLIGSPTRWRTDISLTMLFEPRLKVKQGLQVKSTINSYLNNTTFQVFSFSHQGMISPAVCGDATTKVTMQSLTNPLIVEGR